VSERKVHSLLETQAQVRVISPKLTESLARLAETGAIEYLPRPYQRGDLEGAFLVIAATDDASTNQAVAREAERRHSLVNVVDSPALGNFTLPAVVRRGALTISISTEGQSPALAAHIRRRLEECIGPEYAALLDVLGEQREWVIHACPPERRRDLWQGLVNSDLLDLLREGKDAEARERLRVLVNAYLSGEEPERGES